MSLEGRKGCLIDYSSNLPFPVLWTSRPSNQYCNSQFDQSSNNLSASGRACEQEELHFYSQKDECADGIDKMVIIAIN